jgi:hypothetical protein
MLTREEKILVIGWLREYPAGVAEIAWGYGPLEEYTSEMDLIARDFKRCVLTKYGCPSVRLSLVRGNDSYLDNYESVESTFEMYTCLDYNTQLHDNPNILADILEATL